MDSKEFNSIVEQTFISIQTKLIDTGSKSDSEGGDYLRFYKRAGDHLDCTAERALIGMMDNNLLSLFEIINTLDKSGSLPDFDMISTLTDGVIGNLICLKALLKERIDIREISERKDVSLENIVRDALDKISRQGQRGFKGVDSVLEEINRELSKFDSDKNYSPQEVSKNDDERDIDNDNEVYMASLNKQINDSNTPSQDDNSPHSPHSDTAMHTLKIQGIDKPEDVDASYHVNASKYITELAEVAKCKGQVVGETLGRGVYITDGKRYYNIAQVLLSTLNRIVNSVREVEAMKRDIDKLVKSRKPKLNDVKGRIDTSEREGREAKEDEMLDTENRTKFTNMKPKQEVDNESNNDNT